MLFALALRAWLIPVNPADEGWFVQVVARVLHGEVLYRDVFYNTLPLPVWLTSLVSLPFGAQVLIVRGVALIALLGQLWKIEQISRFLGGSGTFPYLAILTVIVYNSPFGDSPYSILANFFFLCCFERTLRWLDHKERWDLILAAAFAGLAFCTKQNVGVLAFGALFVVSRRAIVLPVFAAIAGAALAPIALSGAWSGFLNFTILNKGRYVSLVRSPFWTPLLESHTLGQVVGALPVLLLPAAALMLAYVFFRDTQARQRTWVVAVFCLAGMAVYYPFAEIGHMGYAVPAACLAIVWCASRIGLPRAIHAAALCGMLFLAVRGTLLPAIHIHEGMVAPTPFEHFRGSWMNQDRIAQFASTSEALRTAPQPLLLLNAYAGFLYLTSGVPNRTPFDYPLVTTFGPHGEEQLAGRIERSEFQSACIAPIAYLRLDPETLFSQVRSQMQPVQKLPICELFAVPVKPGE